MSISRIISIVAGHVLVLSDLFLSQCEMPFPDVRQRFADTAGTQLCHCYTIKLYVAKERKYVMEEDVVLPGINNNILSNSVCSCCKDVHM